MKEIIDQYSPILEGVESTEIKSKIKEKTKRLRLKGSQPRQQRLPKIHVSEPEPLKS